MMGSPAVSPGTFWDVYIGLLGHFRSGPEDPRLEEAFRLAQLGADEEVVFMEGLVRNGDDFVGGDVEMGDIGEYAADFADEEDG